MKSKYEEWSVHNGRLDYCAETLPDPIVKRPRVTKSAMAHPHAPVNLKQTPFLKAQRAVFGASPAREFTVGKVTGVKVEGLKERFGL